MSNLLRGRDRALKQAAMRRSFSTYLRDVAAILVVAIYVLPIVWWGLSAFTPSDALLDVARVLSFDYTPTLDNFALTMLGAGGTIFDSRQSLIDSIIIALLSTTIVLTAALPMAYALSSFTFKRKSKWLRLVLLQRFMPPVPPEMSEAAKLDGATRWESFTKVVLPMVKGGVAATAILVFIFSWTEFLLSLFLTQNLRTMPVQAGILVMNMWGLISSLTVTALIPAFIFVMLVQKHLVRGLTMGLYK
jgi:multiple sugar transport system permease protein